MEIKKLSENKIMVKIEVPIFDIDYSKSEGDPMRQIDTTTLKIRYKKDGNTYTPLMNRVKSCPKRGLSTKYGTKMNKISITFDRKKESEYDSSLYFLPDMVCFEWDENDRKRWRNKQIEMILKD